MASKKNVAVLPFDIEEDTGGGGVRLPEDDYAAKIVKAENFRSSEKDTPGVRVTFEIADGKHQGKKIEDRLWLTAKSMWRVRELLETLGLTIPKKRLKFDLNKLIGKEVGITVSDDDPYQGRIRSKVGAYIDLDTLQEADEGGSDLDLDAADEDDELDDDDEDEVEDDELDDLDLDEL